MTNAPFICRHFACVQRRDLLMSRFRPPVAMTDKSSPTRAPTLAGLIQSYVDGEARDYYLGPIQTPSIGNLLSPRV